MNEADTCRTLVTPKLRSAGWTDEQIREQVTFTHGRIVPSGGQVARKVQKRADYLLYYQLNYKVAVIEAKDDTHRAVDGLAQAKEYARMLGLQYAYATNGHEILEFSYQTGELKEIDCFPIQFCTKISKSFTGGCCRHSLWRNTWKRFTGKYSLRVANVQDGYFDLRQIKEVEVLESEKDKWQLQRGDILLTEGGDWDKLGRGAVWNEEIQNCIHQNHIFRVRINQDEFVPEYLAMLIGSPYGKNYFRAASKQTTNLASINHRQLKAFTVIRPPLDEQRRIMTYLDGLRRKVNALRELQSASGEELSALMPSILDKAFKGEL